jgi:hypothetical protein
MEYLKAADRAKHVRAEIKAMFPEVKFSVKSSTYSLGSNVSVTWTDGPTEEAVTKVIDCLVEDMKGHYDIALNTQYNMISFTRKISSDVWESVRQEVITDMAARNNPYVTDSRTVDRRTSYEIQERSFF